MATPLHVHTREAEAFFVLDGTMTYRADDELQQLGPGSFIYLPSGTPHAFRVTGTSPVRLLALAVPGGLIDLYDDVGIPAAAHRLPGPTGSLWTWSSNGGTRPAPATASGSSVLPSLVDGAAEPGAGA